MSTEKRTMSGPKITGMRPCGGAVAPEPAVVGAGFPDVRGMAFAGRAEDPDVSGTAFDSDTPGPEGHGRL